MIEWLKHAFATETTADPPTAEQQQVVDYLCREIVRRRMTTPALALLEMSRPLNYVTAQGLHMLSPLLSIIGDSRSHDVMAQFLERRDSIDILCRTIEKLEQEATEREKAGPNESSE